MVRVSLDSLRSLQFASKSVLIFIRSTLFLSVLICQREERKDAATHTSGNWRFSSTSKSRVRTIVVVRLGRYFCRPFMSVSLTLKLLLHSNSACLRVSGVLFWHLVHLMNTPGTRLVQAWRPNAGRAEKMCKNQLFFVKKTKQIS